MPTDARPVIIPDFAVWKSRRADQRPDGLRFPHGPAARWGGRRLPAGRRLAGDRVQGWETTLRVTLDQVIYHAEMVARAAQRALVVADLPFLSYQVSPRQALRSAGRLLKETNCQAVKLEGGRKMAADHLGPGRRRDSRDGHVGLQPQTIRRLGGNKVQRSTDEILADAQAVAAAGAFAVVLECIPSSSPPGSPRSFPSPPSASAPGRNATARSWSSTTCWA